MCFQSETPFFKFLRRSVDEASGNAPANFEFHALCAA